MATRYWQPERPGYQHGWGHGLGHGWGAMGDGWTNEKPGSIAAAASSSKQQQEPQQLTARGCSRLGVQVVSELVEALG